jgi:beta-glucosidase
MLPRDFEWGFATAAYQIEGAAAEDGRGPSIWDTFSHLTPSHTNGDNGDIACDHYHRYEEDLDLLAQYGAKAYRFSLSWSRIIPLGGRDDPVNEAGITFYNRLIDGLLARDITPWVTLYHWDLPQALQDRYGGWLDAVEVQRDFERYARLCYERFGDRVKRWITLNEPWNTSVNVRENEGRPRPREAYNTEPGANIATTQGYIRCTEPPGRGTGPNACAPGDPTTEPWIVGRSLILAHARAARLYNVEFKPTQGGFIGASLNGDYFEPWDSSDHRDHEAAERRMDFCLGWFANPIMYAAA